MIILPAIDLRGGKCVRLRRGDYEQQTIYSDHPAEQAVKWAEAGAEYIHLVDLDGAKDGQPVNLAAVTAICAAVSIPCELGGGIRGVDDARRMFDAGVSRVILGTAACENPRLVGDIITEFGSERVVVGIDAKNGRAATRGWLDDSGIDALELAADFAAKGVMRIIYTDIDTDGMLSGPNLTAMAAMCDKAPTCRIIASGGVAKADDVEKLTALRRDNLEGVIIGKALYDGRIDLAELIRQAKKW